MCIIKNFEGVGTEIDGLEQFRISWSYISLPGGIEIGPKDFAIPDNLITEEFILGWNTTTDLPVYATAGAVVLNPIAWYNDTFFLEYYFIDADLNIKAPLLRVPNAYNSSPTQSNVIAPDTLFRVNGKNYPGQNSLLNKTTTNSYPGLTAGVGLTPTQDTSRPTIYECLTDYFLSEMLKHEYKVRNSWETSYGPHSGSQISLHMFGLDRTDYTFLNSIDLYKDYTISTLPSTSIIPTNNIYILENNGELIYSLNSLSDFKYGSVSTPADLGVAIVDFSTGINTTTRPVTIYDADGIEGTTLFYVCNNNLQLQINLIADRYEPTITLTSPILAVEFKRGFNYKYPVSQTAFPSGFISLTPTTGKFPFVGVRPYNLKPHSFGVFGGKNTRAATEFFFKLFRLRQGNAYDTDIDSITTGAQDLTPLVLWGLPTMIVESPINNGFLADSVVGNTNNQVSIRLPFSYKRDGLEWNLAHDICKAFLQNYTIGYHEFTADYSFADEPVFAIGLAPQDVSVITSAISTFVEGTTPLITPLVTFFFSRAQSAGASLPLNVYFEVSGSSTIDIDYVVQVSTTCVRISQYQFFVTIPAGDLTAEVSINWSEDTALENLETIIVTLVQNPSYISTGNSVATYVIIDDDTIVYPQKFQSLLPPIIPTSWQNLYSLITPEMVAGLRNDYSLNVTATSANFITSAILASNRLSASLEPAEYLASTNLSASFNPASYLASSNLNASFEPVSYLASSILNTSLAKAEFERKLVVVSYSKVTYFRELRVISYKPSYILNPTTRNVDIKKSPFNNFIKVN